MPFTVKEHYHAAVIQIQGKFLGSIEGPRFKETLGELIQGGKKRVVVDLSTADFMDSTGMGTLIAGLTTLRKAGGDMRLAGVEKRIKSIFLVTRVLGPVFKDFETVEEALQSFETTPPEPAPKE